MAFEAIFQKSTQLRDVDPSPNPGGDQQNMLSFPTSPASSLPASPGPNKKVQLVWD